MITKKQIIKLLNDHHINYQLTEHLPVRTSQEAANQRGVLLSSGAKAMIVKSKNQFILVVVRADHLINWKKLKKILQVKSIRLATETEAETITGLKMGSVPPFGNLMKLPTYFDQQLFEQPVLNFNIASRSHSIQMNSADLFKLVKPTIADITDSPNKVQL